MKTFIKIAIAIAAIIVRMPSLRLFVFIVQLLFCVVEA